MIPVSVITGFLGSGKTTILSNLLRRAEFADTAVIINEFGEIGLDHDLIETSDETVVMLQTGCLCCKMQGDLIRTLHDLLHRRNSGTIPSFARIVVETSGLADPAPILQSLILDETAAEHFPLARVLTVIDAISGKTTLESHSEARKQLALADHIVISKTDLAGGTAVDLDKVIRSINPTSQVTRSDKGRLVPDLLFAGDHPESSAVLDRIQSFSSTPAHNATEHRLHHHAHIANDIRTFALQRDTPLDAVCLSLFLEALADHCGADLLRLKGLVQIAENPDQPAVIHGVQHIFHPPIWLDAWPSGDHSTRMVFIARNLSESWVRSLLNAIETEVCEIVQESAGRQ
jgi:G3E family GTPase